MARVLRNLPKVLNNWLKPRQTAPKTKAEKQLATVKRKKLAKLEGTDEQLTSVSDDLDFNVVQQKFQQKGIVFEPQSEPQTEFLVAQEREVLFGGQQMAQKPIHLLQTPSDTSEIQTSPDFCYDAQTTSCVKSNGLGLPEAISASVPRSKMGVEDEPVDVPFWC